MILIHDNFFNVLVQFWWAYVNNVQEQNDPFITFAQALEVSETALQILGFHLDETSTPNTGCKIIVT